MAREEVVAGLDIGTTKICTVVADHDDSGRPEIIGVGMSVSGGMKKGVVVDIESATSAIVDSVEKAQRMSGVEIGSAYVGVTGQHITSQNSTGVVAVAQPDHEISEADVVRVVEAQIDSASSGQRDHPRRAPGLLDRRSGRREFAGRDVRDQARGRDTHRNGDDDLLDKRRKVR